MRDLLDIIHLTLVVGLLLLIFLFVVFCLLTFTPIRIKMNILPKKRWHVRTKENIARVRKDEAAAHEEERIKEQKLIFAESEARINFLRQRSGLPEKCRDVVPDTEGKNLEGKADNLEHVNLFADYKTHLKTTNKELEKEKKDEQEKYEKQIGYLTYLGQDTNEALRLKSWYEVAPTRTQLSSDKDVIEKDLKNKHNHDPLTLIKAFLPSEPSSEKKCVAKRNRSPPPSRTVLTDTSLKLKHSKKHKKESKKHKKHHKERRDDKKKSKNKDSYNDVLQKRLKMEQLRKERLRREAIEKARQEALLTPKVPEKQADSAIAAPRVVQKYNSQFNPELAKQNMN